MSSVFKMFPLIQQSCIIFGPFFKAWIIIIIIIIDFRLIKTSANVLLHKRSRWIFMFMQGIMFIWAQTASTTVINPITQVTVCVNRFNIHSLKRSCFFKKIQTEYLHMSVRTKSELHWTLIVLLHKVSVNTEHIAMLVKCLL